MHTPNRKLALRKETLRRLASLPAGDLARVAGGGTLGGRGKKDDDTLAYETASGASLGGSVKC